MSEAEVQVNSTWFYPADRAKSEPSPLGKTRRRGTVCRGVRSNQMLLLRGFGELVAELRMSECNERLRPPGRRQALEIHRAELSHDVVRVDTRRGDRPVEPGDNARALALRRGRLGGDDRFAALRRIRAAHEVELAARGAILVAEHMLGVAGACQVDLDRGVDRDDVVVLRDDARIVDIVDRCALDGG